mgnify:CR=1 FL=1
MTFYCSSNSCSLRRCYVLWGYGSCKYSSNIFLRCRMSKNFRHLKNVIMRNHLCNTLQLQVQLLLKQQYGSGYFAAKLISNDIAKRYAISLNLSLKNVFTYYIAYWILRDMLHSQSPHTYQPLDTFVNLMILMILVHQIWLKNSSFSLQTNTFTGYSIIHHQGNFTKNFGYPHIFSL